MPGNAPANPSTPGATRAPLPLIKLLLHSLSLLVAGALAGAFWYSLGDFAELFASFGVNLPQATRLLMEHQQPAWNILRSALVHQLAWLLSWAMLRERGTHIGLLWASALSWLLVVLLIATLYLPLLTLGSVV